MWILCPGPVIHWHCSQAPPPPCQFRMQFPSGIALVRIGLRRCVTCVFELHAKFVWTRPCRRPPHRWGLLCCRGEPRLCLAFGTKFSLLGFLVVRTVQNSPCMSKKRQIEPFRVSWESFVPEVGPCRACRESFVPHMRCEGCAGRVLYRKWGRAARAGRDLFRRGTFRVCSCRASATHRCPILALGLCSALDTGGGGGFAALGAGCRRVAGVSRL